MKFGNNIQKLREAGSIYFIDALSKIALCAQDVDGKLNYEELTNQLIKDITTNVAKGSFVIFDKISILQSLGLPIQNFVAFIRKIQNIVAYQYNEFEWIQIPVQIDEKHFKFEGENELYLSIDQCQG